MTVFVSNAFSLNMVKKTGSYTLRVSDAVNLGDLLKDGVVVSIKNPAMVDLYNGITGSVAQPGLCDIDLKVGDILIVMQYNGPRLERGCSKIPIDGVLNFYTVELG